MPCGLEPVNSHGPCWMPCVSLEPPPWKMSSVLELTLSVTKLPAIAALVGPLAKVALVDGDPASAKTWSQSWVVVVVMLPSSSNGVAGLTLGVTRPSSASSRSEGRRRRGGRFDLERPGDGS